jgi:hypothetical protein
MTIDSKNAEQEWASPENAEAYLATFNFDTPSRETTKREKQSISHRLMRIEARHGGLCGQFAIDTDPYRRSRQKSDRHTRGALVVLVSLL